MKLAFVAPFERGRQFGGSQRATAMAERLEERGAQIDWLCIPPRPRSVASKARQLVRLRPGLVAYHTAHAAPVHRSADAVVAVHSYMAPYLDSVEAPVPRVVDFHNLEWRNLAALADEASPLRRAYLRGQSLAMRRFERSVMGLAALSLFVTEEELELAEEVARGSAKLLVPNVLPRRDVERAGAIRAARIKSARDPVLVYIGRLTYPPNLTALRGFLRQVWPAVRQSVPGVRLRAVGECSGADRASLASHEGVEASGFVADLAPALAEASAVVLPFGGGAGSSLRILFCALADVPVIGSPTAFRGFPSRLGLSVRTPADWASAVAEVVRDPLAASERTGVAREAALELQEASEPWKTLWGALEGLQ